METALQLELVGRIAIAILLAAAVGLEREFAGKPAGLRTHMLTSGAAAFLVLLGDFIVGAFDPNAQIASDPIRIIQAIVVGVSFLGAGTIFKNRGGDSDYIEGLTTGASLLLVAAIGIAVALGLWWLAVGVTVINVLINWLVDDLAHRLKIKEK